tara:strand:+ start:121 stop:546 length:426 start_codon:yes stop_codon:yes gene_type:complete
MINAQKGLIHSCLHGFFLCALILGFALPAGIGSNGAAVAGELTVGVVQREIKIGMSGADVAQSLGSPNIVSTDSERREVWIYDKISRTSVSDAKKSGGTLLIIGASTQTSSSSTTQKNLTIIVKFDEDNLVRDFSYRQASF